MLPVNRGSHGLRIRLKPTNPLANSNVGKDKYVITLTLAAVVHTIEMGETQVVDFRAYYESVKQS